MQTVSTAFVASRARVAPLKLVSIPRLEIQAAVMASRLAQAIREEQTGQHQQNSVLERFLDGSLLDTNGHI